MKFQTTTIEGTGIGKSLGFPTINMVIPENIPITLRPGVYAAAVAVKGQAFYGVLYYGPRPLSKEPDSVLQVHVLDSLALYVGEDELIEIDTLKFVRGVMDFEFPELYTQQMERDIEAVRKACGI